MVPAALKGKDFESALLESAAREEKAGRLTMCRYGVQGVTFGDKTMLVPSLPDFDGVLAGGRSFNIEAKCCKGASFELRDDKFKARQYSHMSKRSLFSASCWIVLHFAERRMVKKIDPGMTVAVPVHPDMPFWKSYEAGEVKSLTREMALTIGIIVPWVTPKGCRKPLPDLMAFLNAF